MKTKQEIVENWLPRYTGMAIEQFGQYILLTNFSNYLDLFVLQTDAKIVAKDKAMPIELKVPNAETRAAMKESRAMMKSAKAAKSRCVMVFGG